MDETKKTIQTRSETLGELAKALAKFQGEVGSISKDATNPFFRSKYATLDSIIKAVKEPLSKNGLSYTQLPDGEGLTTVLLHSSGEFISCVYSMPAKDNTPQGRGSALTYMRRYALSAVLGVAADEDDDGNTASEKTDKDKPFDSAKALIESANTAEVLESIQKRVNASDKFSVKEKKQLNDLVKTKVQTLITKGLSVSESDEPVAAESEDLS